MMKLCFYCPTLTGFNESTMGLLLTALSHVYLGGAIIFAWLFMAAGSQCTPAMLMAACEGRSPSLPVASEWLLKLTHVHVLYKPSLYYR